jgi:hypothetical protein
MSNATARAAQNATLSCRSCQLFARMITEAPLDEASRCPLCKSTDVDIEHLGAFPDFRPLPYMRAVLHIDSSTDAAMPQAIKAGDVVLYSPEDGVVYFARVADIWTGAAYSVGNLPGLAFRIGDTITRAVRHWKASHEGEAWWAYPSEVRPDSHPAAYAAPAKPAPAKPAARTRRPQS